MKFYPMQCKSNDMEDSVKVSYFIIKAAVRGLGCGPIGRALDPCWFHSGTVITWLPTSGVAFTTQGTYLVRIKMGRKWK